MTSVVPLEVNPVTADRWRDLVELFERPGPRGGHQNSPAPGCWCMYWRNRALGHGTPKKHALGSLVRAGREPGLLAYEGGSAVGWISIAPRDEFREILRSPQYRPRDDDEDVWSIVCFVIDRPARRRGVAGALLEAAVDHARSHGGRLVEAYAHTANPHDYMGGVDLYVAHGFVPYRPANKRTLMRRAL